jgi:hypothetical protein
MDFVTDAIDAINHAGKLAHEVDMEIEAISEANLGNIYFMCLKDNQRARTHLYNSLKLSNTLYPKLVDQEPWF